MKIKLVWLYLYSLVLSCNFAICQKSAANFKNVQTLQGIEEYLYQPNGMRLLLVQDNSTPVATVQIVYHVGSKNEVTGNTGSAHLLEHLLFKGTPLFNKSKGTSVDQILSTVGGQINATTWNDRTNYYETIPSDNIESAIQIEADRMRNALLLQEDKEAEMTVVRNEFERGDNNPNSLLEKEIWASAYIAHPYHHNTIGWLSDIEKMPIEVLRNFYHTYYWPNNATLTIIGDFEKESIFKLVDKYFAGITKSPHQIPAPYTTEPDQNGPRRVTVKKPGEQSIVTIAYKTPEMMHSDFPALKVLSQIIGSGTSSVLSKSFVDTGKAYYGDASVSEYKEPGLFSITLGFSPDVSNESINKEMLDVVEKIKKDGVVQSDVDRVVAKINTSSVLARDGSDNIASFLNEAIAGGDWRDYVLAKERLLKVTAEDVKRVANTYLQEDQSTTGYFIPQVAGDNQESDLKPAQRDSSEGKYFYREAGVDFRDVKHHSLSGSNHADSYERLEEAKKENEFERKSVAGIDVVSVKTGAKDFVTVTASFPIDAYLTTGKNDQVPSLLTEILSKGTKKHNKFMFSEKLEKLGVSLDVTSSKFSIKIIFKSLRKDLKEVMNLLAEELRMPLFDNSEFELIKNQRINEYKQEFTNTATQASIALSQAIYPKGHPNYQPDIQTTIENIESATLEDLKAFHRDYFGPAGMHLVAVGDVDSKELYNSVNDAFKGWKGGKNTKSVFSDVTKGNSLTKVITIPEKPSCNMLLGQYTGLQYKDQDYIPFFVGTFALGGGSFSGRLMQTVRDRDGLTYGIYAGNSGNAGTLNVGGFFNIEATFNPELLQKGLDTTMKEVAGWVDNGLTINELEMNKSIIKGSFKVSMATTTGLANTILNFIERGLDPDYIYQYPKDIQNVTLDQVNRAIKKYIQVDKMIIIKSGSLDKNGNPLQ